MLMYYLTGISLKLFSCCRISRSLYRLAGNTIGAYKRIRGQLPYYYIIRLKRLVNTFQKYQIFENGGKLLELGTGWMHWEALTARLFFNFQASLFDVWDNRQLSGLKNFVRQIEPFLPELSLNDIQRKQASALIKRVINVESFEKLYELLGFTYIVDPSGITDNFEQNSFDAVISAGVLEHVRKDQLPQLLLDIRKVLKPNGYSIHSINLRDHLLPYSRRVFPKQYLKYSEDHWRRWLQNDVQYINRVQASDWIKLFGSAGLEIVEEDCEREKVLPARISKTFSSYSLSDLEVTWLRLIHINGCLTKSISSNDINDQHLIGDNTDMAV